MGRQGCSRDLITLNNAAESHRCVIRQVLGMLQVMVLRGASPLLRFACLQPVAGGKGGPSRATACTSDPPY